MVQCDGGRLKMQQTATTFYRLGINKLDNSVLVFDSRDYSIELLKGSEYEEVKEKGYVFRCKKDLCNLFGVMSDEFGYKLVGSDGVTGNIVRSIWEDYFKSKNNRNDLYAPKIHLNNVECTRNFIFLTIGCSCWCKYDIEYPMYMETMIALSYSERSLKNEGVSKLIFDRIVYSFSQPVYLSNQACYNQMLASCEEYGCDDFPIDCALFDYTEESIRVTENGLYIFDKFYDFSLAVPHHLDMFEELKRLGYFNH